MDIKTLVEQILKQFEQSVLMEVAKYSPEIKSAGMDYLNDAKESLSDLAAGALSQELTYAFVVKRLAEEEVTLKDALIGLEQMIATDFKVVVNNLIGVFETLLKGAILTIK